MPQFAEKLEKDIKDDLTAGLWEMVNSTIDLGVQLPKRDFGIVTNIWSRNIPVSFIKIIRLKEPARIVDLFSNDKNQ